MSVSYPNSPWRRTGLFISQFNEVSLLICILKAIYSLVLFYHDAGPVAPWQIKYGRLFHTVTPSPIFKQLRVVSNPISPSSNIGFTAAQLIVVSLLICILKAIVFKADLVKMFLLEILHL